MERLLVKRLGILQGPLCLGPLVLGAGSIRVAGVRGENLRSLITHPSRVFPTEAWGGSVSGWGLRFSGPYNRSVVRYLSYNAFCRVAAFRPT